MSAVEAVDAAIGRIEAVDPSVHAVVADAVRRGAGRGGRPVGRRPVRGRALPGEGARCAGDRAPDLAGVAPVGRRRRRPPTAWRWRGRAPPGVIVLGMTNTPELGKNGSTEPLFHGPTRNPHDLIAVAGRVERRLGGGGGVGHGADRARQRRWRVDPHPVGRVRSVRAQAVARAGAEHAVPRRVLVPGRLHALARRARCATARRCSTRSPDRRPATR